MVKEAMRVEVDGGAAELRAGGEQPLRDARKEERAAEDARERLVRSIRDGLVTDRAARAPWRRGTGFIGRGRRVLAWSVPTRWLVTWSPAASG
jgi:hypothetical protein